MDLQDLTPALGGLLSGPAAARPSEPVATFTTPQYMHPDSIWSPRGSEIAPPQRPLTPTAHVYKPDVYESAPSARPVEREHVGDDMTGNIVSDHARMIRATLRPGMAPG